MANTPTNSTATPAPVKMTASSGNAATDTSDAGREQAPTPVTVVNPTPGEQAATESAKKAEQREQAAPEKAKAVAERGDPVVAVNLITQTGDDGKAEDITPGTVFRPAKVDIAFLTKAEAIREPTEGERAIYDALQRQAEAAAADADDTLG